MGRFSTIIQRLEVNHEPGLTQTQMFLSVCDNISSFIVFVTSESSLLDAVSLALLSLSRMRICCLSIPLGESGKDATS